MRRMGCQHLVTCLMWLLEIGDVLSYFKASFLLSKNYIQFYISDLKCYFYDHHNCEQLIGQLDTFLWNQGNRE